MPNSLDKNWKDRSVNVTIGTLSLVPFVGGLLGTVLKEAISGLRQDRLADYILKLEEKFNEFEEETRRGFLSNHERLDLMEQGGLLALRSLSSERIQQVVNAVVNGMTADQHLIIRHKRILNLLSELDDEQLLLLSAYQNYEVDRENHCWDNLNRPKVIDRREKNPTPSGDDFELYKLGRDHLVRLNLLELIPTQNGVRKFVQRNPAMNQDDALQITYLGKFLLREIGL